MIESLLPMGGSRLGHIARIDQAAWGSSASVTHNWVCGTASEMERAFAGNSVCRYYRQNKTCQKVEPWSGQTIAWIMKKKKVKWVNLEYIKNNKKEKKNHTEILKSLSTLYTERWNKGKRIKLRLNTYTGVSECVAVTVLDGRGQSDDFLFHSGCDTRSHLLDFHWFTDLGIVFIF